ncbi:hypothetical protein D3C87_277600 [compost metagenome]
MRHIAFLTILGVATLISCKKKETQPEPTAPEPTSPTTLTIEQTYDALEAGTWLADSVEFYQNNTITQTAYLVKDYTFTTVGGTIKQLKWENSPATFSYVLSNPTTIAIQGGTAGQFSGTQSGTILNITSNRLILKCPDTSTEGTYRYFHR